LRTIKPIFQNENIGVVLKYLWSYQQGGYMGVTSIIAYNIDLSYG